MTISEAASLLLVLTALFAYLNARVPHLPGTIEALSLPASPYRDTLVMMTYGCALFASAVRGLTVGRLVARSG